MSTIYLAGPLFCEAKQAWHRSARTRVEAETGHKVLWPLELFGPCEIDAWGADAPRRVMERCRDAMAACDFVVALLDGPQVDDGTAWEIGFAHAHSMAVVGVRTDFRQAGDVPGALVNAMVHASCEVIVRSLDDLLEHLKRR